MKYKVLNIILVIILIITLFVVTGCGKIEEQEERNNVEEHEEETNKVARINEINIRDIYEKFISEGEYKSHTKDWREEAEKYCIYDINQDGTEELIIMDREMEFHNTLLFSYDREKEKIIFVDDIYSYGEIRYSERDKEIAYAEFKPFKDASATTFYKLNNNKIEGSKSVGYDMGKYFLTVANGEIGEEKEISETEYQAYYNELTNFQFIDISTLEKILE